MFEFLKKIPYISSAVSFVFGNVRLVIEYVLIALIIAGTASAIALWYRTKFLEASNDNLRERIISVELTNQLQDKTIVELQELRERDVKVISELAKDYEGLSKTDARARKQISVLESKDADVREYLDRPIPPELACVLNDTCPPAKAGVASGKGNAPSPAAGAVPKARATGTPNNP